jgi:hypothetical protein
MIAQFGASICHATILLMAAASTSSRTPSSSRKSSKELPVWMDEGNFGFVFRTLIDDLLIDCPLCGALDKGESWHGYDGIRLLHKSCMGSNTVRFAMPLRAKYRDPSLRSG